MRQTSVYTLNDFTEIVPTDIFMDSNGADMWCIDAEDEAYYPEEIELDEL